MSALESSVGPHLTAHAMITAWMSERSKRSLILLLEPESSEYRSTLESVERLWADFRDREKMALRARSLDACTAG